MLISSGIFHVIKQNSWDNILFHAIKQNKTVEWPEESLIGCFPPPFFDKPDLAYGPKA